MKSELQILVPRTFLTMVADVLGYSPEARDLHSATPDQVLDQFLQFRDIIHEDLVKKPVFQELAFP